MKKLQNLILTRSFFSDDPAVMEPNVQRSIGSSGVQLVSFPLFFTVIPVLLALMLQ